MLFRTRKYVDALVALAVAVGIVGAAFVAEFLDACASHGSAKRAPRA